MSKHSRLRAAMGMAMAAVAAVSSVWPAAAAQTSVMARVESLTVALEHQGVVDVSGVAAFADVPVQVADDPSGDSLGASIGLPLGDDLTTATISRRDPLADTVTFSLSVANQPPELMGVPETLVYNWNFSYAPPGTVNAEDWELRAMRTAALYPALDADPYFAIAPCNPVDGAKNCGFGQRVTGRMRDGVVEWELPLTGRLHSFSRGGLITNRTIDIWLAASGAASTNTIVPDAAPISEASYTVRVPVVRMGIGPSGTPASETALTEFGTLGGGGHFGGTVPRPAGSGMYTVAVEACYGPDICDVATQDILI